MAALLISYPTAFRFRRDSPDIPDRNTDIAEPADGQESAWDEIGS